MSCLYSSGLWLPSNVARKVGRLLVGFLQAYSRLAAHYMRNGLVRFSLMPKLHFVHHCGLWLIDGADRGRWVMSPLATSVQMQEDFIGKPSRLSRRVAPGRLIHVRVMDRSLIATMKALKTADEDDRGLQ